MNKKAIALMLLGVLACAAVVTRAEDMEGDDSYDEDDYEDGEGGFEDADVAAEAVVQEAAQQRRSDHPLSNLPPAHPDIEIVYRIADVDAGKLPLGDAVDAVIGLVNKGDKDVNVISMGGSLNSPFDFGFYIQNFTLIGYNTTVPAGGESAFMYRFGVSPQLEPVDYQVALTMFYSVDDGVYSSTFLNDTQAFYTTTSEFDAQTIFSTVSGLIIAVVVLSFLYTATDKPNSTVVLNVPLPASTEKVDEDYMASYNGPGGKKSGGKKRS